MPNPTPRKHPPPAHQRVADLRIGKKGITPELLQEVKRRIKEHRTLKVKILRAALTTENGVDQLAQSLVESADAHLVEVRGHTFVMTRKSKLQR
jgi:RNA-binding protein